MNNGFPSTNHRRKASGVNKQGGKSKSKSGSKPADVIELAHDYLVLTEVAPSDGRFVGKQILSDGRILDYPSVAFWDWTTARIPATPIALFDYLCKLQQRNACLIRGIPKPGLPQQGVRRNGENFLDEPSRVLFFDVDGAPADWRPDPEAAVTSIVQRLGEPWASSSFVWYFSAKHGLVTEKIVLKDADGNPVKDKKGKVIIHEYWRGEIGEGMVRVRLVFILDRALTWRNAATLTKTLDAKSGVRLDSAISRTVQPNYTTRMKWHAQPGRDVLGDDIKRIGWVKGARDVVDIPAVTLQEMRWAHAEGHGADIASHPDALSAVRAIGSDGAVRSHMMAAIWHLVKIEPAAGARQHRRARRQSRRPASGHDRGERRSGQRFIASW
jgi:hypothetical protein